MRLKFIFLSIIILIQSNNLGFCQPVYFNNLYCLGDPSIWSGAVTLSEEVDGYFICGKAGNDIAIIKLNDNGEQLWSKTWGDSLSSWYVGYPGSLQSIDNQHYLACSKNFYSRIRQVSFVMHFDNNWDTTWTKEYDLNYDENPDTGTLIQNIALCNNRDLVFTGSLARPDLGARILLIRCDNLGSILWYELYTVNPSGVNDGYSVIQTSDGGFAIGGFYYVIGNNDSGDPIIIKTDSLGNKEWLKNLGGPYEDNAAMLCQANDGNILMGTTITDSAFGSTTFSKIHIKKFDNEGNTLWNKRYGQSQVSNYLSNIRSMNDGSILCVGSVWSEAPWNIGWILKLNSVGDSLWYREYYILGGESTYNRLMDIISTNDSGFISCGYIAPAPPDPGIQSAWVIKLDSIGCEFAGCDTTVGVKEHGGGEAWGLGGLEIWPNPARDWIVLTMPEFDLSHEMELAIYNLFGQEVMKTRAVLQSRSVSMNISSLPSGVYFVTGRDSHQRALNGKFVVSH
jgi:hypothetical protein